MTFVRLVAVCFMLLATSVDARAGEHHRFDAKTFQAATESGKPVVVHITAPWCGECRAQKPIVAELIQRTEFQDLIVFEADFDSQKDALRQFKAQKQSTLIAFRGKEERGRAVGITRPDKIEALMKKAL
jgi:thiol-disulfide isomerase/thioredoxin